jgi:two-component system, chemotaxis family, chemotaxis protein CheY
MDHVIIADDSDTARMFVRRCFEIAGLAESTIHEARDGNHALELLENTLVELVITDLNMPGLDGKALLGRIRNEPRWRHIPVIVISSAANSELQRELREMGAQAVMKKPPSPEHAAKCLDVLRRRLEGV